MCCTLCIFFGNCANSGSDTHRQCRARLAGLDAFHAHCSTSSIALFPPNALISAPPLPSQGFVTGPKRVLQTPLSQGAAFIPCARAHRVRMDELLHGTPDQLLTLPRYHPRTSSPGSFSHPALILIIPLFHNYLLFFFSVLPFLFLALPFFLPE